jgi:O-antigen/teichoic acid export membrane protein
LRSTLQSALAPSLSYVHLRRWGRPVILGIIEQGIYSAANFAFAVVLLNSIGARQFGTFNIAWSIVMLAECILYSPFGDAVPAIANRLPRSAWPELRAAVYFWSALFSGGVMVSGAFLSLLALVFAPKAALLVLMTGITVFTMRAQQMGRRICYLDGTRALAVVGAILFSVTVFLSLGALLWFGVRSSVAGMICLGLGCAASSTVLILRRRDFRWPAPKLLRWSWHKLWRSGRWLTAASISYWAANTGLIPLAGVMFGREAGGVLRIVQTLTNPLSQLTSVIVSVVLPPAAERLRVPTRAMFARVSIRSLVPFVAISAVYSIGLTIYGPALVHLLFHGKITTINTAVLAVACLAASLDMFSSALTVPLLATSRTSVILFGRVASLAALCVVLPFALHLPGLIAFVSVTAASNLVQTLVLSWYQVRQYERLPHR